MSAPVTLVLFGATGDLAVKKIFPAINRLAVSGDLHPETHVIATSRRPWNDSDFHSFLADAGVPLSETLAERVTYVAADFDAKQGYDSLARAIAREGDKDLVVYLSLAPVFFEDIIGDLKREGILTRGSAKLLLEKPFGTSEESAVRLNGLLHSFLNPEQIYRIDHYLGKATLQAIMRMHEASDSLRYLLSNQTVASVTVELLETKGIDGRASYDKVGAFRDVGQNHLLEMLAVTFAEYPKQDAATAWHDARAMVIESLKLPRRGRITARAGQYEGYRNERGVEPASRTETAFEVATAFDRGELQGIPVTLRAGKRMREASARFAIAFKEIAALPQTLTFEVQPDPRAIFSYRNGTDEIIPLHTGRDAYEHVMLDAFRGELRHFVGAREALAAWHYTDRLMHCLRHVPLEPYDEETPFA